MNQPEDRSPTGNEPASADDQPEQPQVPPAPAAPPSDRLDEALESFRAPTPPPPPPVASAAPPPPPPEPPAAPPAPTPAAPPPPAPAPPPEPPAPARRPPAPAPAPAPEPPLVARTPSPPSPSPPAPVALDDSDDDDDLSDYDDELDEEPLSRWASLLATVGTALVGIVGVQVVTSIVEGLTLKQGQRVGDIPEDLFHRLGYPFGGLGATALVFLVLGVVLVSLPSVLDEYLSPSQDRMVRYALIVAVVLGVIIAIGSLLAVRANLHEYSAKGVAVPAYARVQFTNFLLGSLGAAALALFGAIAAMNERSRERLGD
jgi:hypothetical protein